MIKMSVEIQFDRGLVWFRRDLRINDNAALHHALLQCRKVFCVFVFDTAILDQLPRQDRRVTFIWDSVGELDAALREAGGQLIILHGHAKDAVPRLAEQLGIDAVFANHDYEPQALVRDAAVQARLNASQRRWFTFKDQVIFERDELMTLAGSPFSVFTPYKNAWLKRVHSDGGEFWLKSYPVRARLDRLARLTGADHELLGTPPTLANMGFDEGFRIAIPAGERGAHLLFSDFCERLDSYRDRRDFPAVKGPSYLSVHLRFGTISIRSLARHAWEQIQQTGSAGAQTWLSELIWRDFYFQILHHHPHVVRQAFKPEYDRIQWDNDATQFAAWCEGRTGYPLVDAAMVQLNTTGYMHNRLRMIVASFLTKDLGIDWRWGERYFALKLNDFDLAANNGGWQWAASSGCDAQPYFRIFNPVTQSERFDPDGRFIVKYLPQLARFSAKQVHAPWLLEPLVQRAAGCVIGTDYPTPIVAHDAGRLRTLERYSVVKAAPPAT
jgi:deoxyribodipyrimidine photo-lyase